MVQVGVDQERAAFWAGQWGHYAPSLEPHGLAELGKLH